MTDIAPARPPAKPRLRAIGDFLQLLGAALVVGGIVTSAIAGVLAFRSPEILSHEQAGLFAAKVFDRVLVLQLIGALLVGLGVAVSRPRMGWAPHMARVGFVMITLGIIGEYRLANEMRALRADAGGSIDKVAKEDPRRVEFGKLHQSYEGASLVALAGGVLVLVHFARKQA